MSRIAIIILLALAASAARAQQLTGQTIARWFVAPQHEGQAYAYVGGVADVLQAQGVLCVPRGVDHRAATTHVVMEMIDRPSMADWPAHQAVAGLLLKR